MVGCEMAFVGFRSWSLADAFLDGIVDRKKVQHSGAMPQM
jgi:hypothetical protein